MHDRNSWAGYTGRVAVVTAILATPVETAIAADAALSGSSDGSSVAADEPAAASPSALAEVVVTAEKRSERINDVGMSITAATADQLTEQGITDTAQLGKIVPGFTYQKSTYGVPVFTIRGIGFYDTAQGDSPAVSVYVDQVPLPYSIMTKGAMLDLERVEVLKGPQGTLFGQNSTGGAINYIAAKPTESFQAGADLTYGRFNDVITSGFVSGPLGNQLTARLAVSHEGANGWQFSTSRPGDTLGAKDFTNARLLLDWKPRDDLRMELNINGWHDSGQTVALQAESFIPSTPESPGNQFIYNALQGLQTPQNNRAADWYPGVNYARNDTFYQAALRTDWDITNSLFLTSISAYSKLRDSDPVDTSGTAFPSILVNQATGSLASASEELRLAGLAGPARWMVGGNYQRDSTYQDNEFILDGTNTIVPVGSGFGSLDRVTNILWQQPTTESGFASLDYSVTDALTAQVSGRYTEQRRKFSGCLGDAGTAPSLLPGEPPSISWASMYDEVTQQLTGVNPHIPPFGCVTLDAATLMPGLVRSNLNQDNTSWRAGLNWKVTPDALLYVSATQGFKSGGYSDISANSSTQFNPVTQERVLAYEAGFKQTLLDRKIDVTGAVFYYNYKDKQVLGSTYNAFGVGPALINIPKSYVAGAELNATVRPVSQLTLSGGVTYVKSRVQTNPGAPFAALTPFGVSTSFIGDPLPNTPAWMGNLDAVYTIPVRGERDVYFGASSSTRSSAYAQFGDLSSFRIPGYTLVDLRAGLKTEDEKWRFELWAHNVANKTYWQNIYYGLDVLARSVGDPLTYGISVSYRFQ